MRFAAPRTHLALAICLAPLALACAASSARAEAWGEVDHFALKAGTAAGEVNERGLVRFAAGNDGSYYVLTEAKPSTGEFILQRYHEKAKQAEVVFESQLNSGKEEEGKLGSERGTGAMLAVNPAGNRVYVLLVYERREENEKEEKEEEKEEKEGKTPYERFPLDSEMPAAGSLFAFEYRGGKLVSSRVKKEQPAPAVERIAFEGVEHASEQSEQPKKALLDPRGIAVDPATGDLAITGNQDEESNENVEKKPGTLKQCRPAVQFVAVKSEAKGQIEALTPGARYVDKEAKALFGQTGCGEGEEEEAIDQAPASPAFAPDGSLLGYGEDEEAGPEGVIWQLAPAGADTAHASGEFPMTPKELFVAESIPAFEPIVGEEEPASVMSLVPDEEGHSATDGTIYLSGHYVPTGQPGPAVLHYSDPHGEPSITEIGWTAGGAVDENAGPLPCDLHKSTHEPTMLGGLAGAKRGLLALAFYKEFQGPGHEVEVKHAEVLEFGEGGSTKGCPGGSGGPDVPVTTPTQSLHGEPTSTVPAGTPLKITSVLGTVEGVGNIVRPAAGAKSVEWTVKFTPLGGGAPQTEHFETKYEYDGLHEEEAGYGIVLKLDQTFNAAGAYEITDAVHTDDLALAGAVQPAAADKLTVTGGKLHVDAEVPEPPTVFAHEQKAKLKARVEVPGEEALHLKRVAWEFGDGEKQEETNLPEITGATTTLEAEHAFARCGSGSSTKCKVTVTVEAEGTAEGTQIESVQVEITVKENKAEEEAARKHAEEEAAANKRAEEEAARKRGEEEAAAAAVAARKRAEEEAAAARKRGEEEAIAKKRAEEEAAKGGVAGYIASFAGSALSVSRAGKVSFRITCPSGGSCSGKLTLRTLHAVAASHRTRGSSARKQKKRHRSVLTLASGPFSLTGGSRSVTLHLSARARTLLAKSHGVLHAKLTILSRGTAGQKDNVTTHVVTLRLAKKKSHAKKSHHKH